MTESEFKRRVPCSGANASLESRLGKINPEAVMNRAAKSGVAANRGATRSPASSVGVLVAVSRRLRALAARGIGDELAHHVLDLVHLHVVAEDAQHHVDAVERGWLVFYGGEARVREFPIERDDAFLGNELVPGCLRFAEQITRREAPPLDPQCDLFVPEGAALTRWRALGEEYRRLSAASAQHEAPLLALKERLAATR